MSYSKKLSSSHPQFMSSVQLVRMEILIEGAIFALFLLFTKYDVTELKMYSRSKNYFLDN